MATDNGNGFYNLTPVYPNAYNSALSFITPFTHRTNISYSDLLMELYQWLREIHLPEIDKVLDEFHKEYLKDIEEMRKDITDTKTNWQELFDAFIVNITNELKALNDEAVAQLVDDKLSKLYQALLRFSNENVIMRGTDIVTLKDYGAKGDSVTDDTTAWNLFQSAKGFKIIQPGSYLVNGETKTFLNGVLGNGEFLDPDSAWEQPRGDREQESILVHRADYDASETPVSPIIKTQAHVNYERDTPVGSFKHITNSYHEATLDGYYNTQSDTNQNFTVTGATGWNRMAGLFGMLSHLAYVKDATELEQPLIASIGATKNGCQFLQFTRRAQHRWGGYMFGQEIYCMNQANETDDIPYENNDYFSWNGSWTSGIKIAGNATGAPISAAIFTHGLGSKHGFYNGLVVGGTGFRINNNPYGAKGTVAINLASHRDTAGYSDIGIKFRTNNRHIHFNEGAKINVSLMRLMNPSGNAGLSIEAGSSPNTPYLHFRGGVDDTPTGGSTVVYGQIDVNNSWSRLQSNTGEVQLSANGGSATYVANSARFAPSTANNGTQQLGASDRRWDNIYAVNGVINTSDARKKTEIGSIPDEALDAWGDVDFVQYKMTDAVETKSGARLHTGVIAQAVIEAFKARGLDASDYGLLCHDSWGDSPESVHEYTTVKEPAVYERVLVKEATYKKVTLDDGSQETVEDMPAEYTNGEMVKAEVVETHTTVTPAIVAGDLYGIRYDEAQAMESAFQRRRANRLEERISKLEMLLTK